MLPSNIAIFDRAVSTYCYNVSLLLNDTFRPILGHSLDTRPMYDSMHFVITFVIIVIISNSSSSINTMYSESANSAKAPAVSPSGE